MLATLTTTNYVAILISAVVAFIIGALWYSPFLFGGLWAKEMGFTPEKKKEAASSMYPAMAVSFVTYLVTAYVMTLAFRHLPVTDSASALSWAFLLWLGFTGAVQLMHTMYSGKSFTTLLINAGYNLVYIEAIAFILSWWK